MLNYSDNEKSLICKFPERMDTYKSQEVEKELKTKISGAAKNVVFDLKDVKFISSYFLRICLEAVKAVGHERFEVINTTSDIKKVFVIAGYDKFINIK